MSQILNAAKLGNKAELERLKKERGNLQETDSYGNTALHWSACNGHWETVKWLLSAKCGFNMTASNHRGDSALSLAAAFGRLEVVQCLLSDNNKADDKAINASLFKAASNGQLPIVDYLIRTYYLKSGLTKELQQQCAAFGKHEGIYYYLEVFDIFSKKPINSSQLALVLEKAEQLKIEERSFIYLICCWMQVHSKAKTLPCSVMKRSDEPFMQKLLVSHQSELLLYMFQKGYILTHWSIDQDQLNTTSILLNKRLSDKIEKKLKQSEKDLYFTSRESVIERERLYVDYYLKPVYHSLVLAAQTDNLDNALKDPYTYHLNTTEGPIVADDIAKWTAYHLCQRSDTPLKTHQKAYARTSNSSRLAYYETVKETLRDETQYTLCFNCPESSYKEKTIYFELIDEGSLQYTVLIPSRVPKETVGKIQSSQLGIKLTAPLDLKKLEPIVPGILELISSEGHIPLQKKSLLLSLGNMAESDGKRLYWTKEYPHWLHDVNQGFSTKQETQNTLTLIGQKEPIPIRDALFEKIWDSKKHQPQPSKLPGNHPVYKLTLSEGHDIYCKLYPGLPGINDALHYLYRRVFGATQGLPWSVVGVLKIDNQTIPVLLSEDAGSTVKVNDLRLDHLDSYTLSKLILFTILTNLEDGKLDNVTLTQNARGFYDIYYIDYDQGLVEPTKKTDSWFSPSEKLSVKSLLYCLDAMNKPLDKRAVKEFLALKPMDVLKAWLKDLILLAEQYEQVFQGCPDPLKESNPYRRSYLQMVLPVATLIHMAAKMQWMQTALEDTPQIAPLSLLKKLEPVVAHFYEPKLQETATATKRFDDLVKEGGLYGWNAKTKSYSTTLTLSKELFESFVPDNKAEVVSPQIALKELETIHQKWEKLEREHVEVMKGEIAQFSKFSLEEQQAMLKLMRLDQLSAIKRKLLLETLSQRVDFKVLYLRYPQAQLTNSLLMDLLKNNTKLQHLSLTNAPALTSLRAFKGASSLTKIKLSQLVQIKKLTFNLKQLTELTLNDIPELTTVKIVAPNLHRLRIINCKNLEKLELPRSRSLEHVTIQDCGKLLLADFYSSWPGFISRWRKVPPRFRQRLADCISRFFIEPKGVSKKSVYKTVMSYLDELNQFCEQVQRPSLNDQILLETILFRKQLQQRVTLTNSFGIAYFLAHLGYDDPIVISVLYSSSQFMRDISITNVLNKFTLLRNDVHYRRDSFFVAAPHLADTALRALDEEVVEFNLWSGFDSFIFIRPVLLEWLNDPTTLCTMAANVVEALKIDDDRVITTLLDKLVDKDFALPSISIAVIQALGALQSNDARIMEGLLGASRDNDHRVSSAAILVLQGLNESNEFVRVQAIKKVLAFMFDRYTSDHHRETCVQIIEQLLIKDGNIIQLKDKSLIHGLSKVLVIGDSINKSAIHALIKLYQLPTALEPRFADLMTMSLEESTKEISSSSDASSKEPTEQATPSASEQDSTQTTDVTGGITKKTTGSPDTSSSKVDSAHTTTSASQLGSTQTTKTDTKNTDITDNGEKKSDTDSTVPPETSQKKPSFDNKKGFFSPTNINKKVGGGSSVKKEDKESSSDLFSLAESSNVEEIKKRLSEKVPPNVKDKNKNGDTALSLAAKKGDLALVDYLIRTYYVGEPFDRSEIQILDSTPENNATRLYLDLFVLCSQKPINKEKVTSLFDKAAKELKYNDLSYLNLLYLWMQVENRAPGNSSAVEAIPNEPQMHQLQPEHQMELILHMIREGHVLKGWTINSEKLVIREMTLDKKQVNALEQLVAQSGHRICLNNGQDIEKNTVYLSLNASGILEFTFCDFSGGTKKGVIQTSELNLDNALTEPFTLDQLKSIPDVLEIVSKKVGILAPPTLKTLIFEKVRFTKKYELRSAPPDNVFQKNMVYVYAEDGFIKYKLLLPNGKLVSDTISGEALQKMGLKTLIKKPRERVVMDVTTPLKPIFLHILELTTQRGHTIAECSTWGYRAFLAFLEKRFLMPHLHTLHLQDCDLSDDFDLGPLYEIVVQHGQLHHLNLDHNQMCQIGLDKLLRALRKNPVFLSNLEVLSVRFNKIAIKDCSVLGMLSSAARPLKALHVEGNLFVHDPGDISEKIIIQQHKKRVEFLHELFLLLSAQDSKLTIRDFLTASITQDAKRLRFTIQGSNQVLREVDVFLDGNALQLYDGLRYDEDGEKTKILVREYPELLPYLRKGMSDVNIPETIQNLAIPGKNVLFKEQKKLCKLVLRHHEEAPFKSQLLRNSIFKCEHKEIQPSLLFPETCITLEQGRVYLIAYDPDVRGSEHVMAAYEYLSGSGQRFFKVAHLFRNKNDKPQIEFKYMDMENVIPWLHSGHLIASYSRATWMIKNLHKSIKSDVDLKENLPFHYFTYMFGSSRNKKVMNCLTYLIHKFEKCVDIWVDMSGIDLFPSTVVNNEIQRNKQNEEVNRLNPYPSSL